MPTKMTREEFERRRQERMKSALSSVKSGYRIVITPHFEQKKDMTEEEHARVDALNQPIEFDYVDSKSVTSSSEITSYPTVSGDTIADHMIKQADVVSISGKFSLYGNKPTEFVGSDDRLTNAENFFEKIKNEGVMCTITSIDRKSNSKSRFKTRSQMVLNSIRWDEKESYIAFDLTFTEALTVEMEEAEVDYTDPNVPTITDPNTMNFTDEFLDKEQITNIITYQLQEVNLLTTEFAAWISQNESTIRAIAIGAGVVAVAVGAKVLSTIIAAATIGLSSGPVGWIILGAALVITAISAAFIAILNNRKIKEAEKEYGVKAFDKKETDEENTAEAQRLCQYIGEVNQQLDVLNNYIQVFSLKINEEQECMLYIGSYYYIFTFTKNNTQTDDDVVTWKLNIAFSTTTTTKDIADISGQALKSIEDCTLNNMLFQTEDGIWVYILNNKLYSVENDTYDSEEERQTAINECKSNLSNYIILASQTNMQELMANIDDIVIEAMKA